MAEADERDDGGGLHEIEVTAEAAEQRPCAIPERSGGAERHQQVHVCTAGFELVPTAAIEASAGNDLHHGRQTKRKPLEPRRGPESESPFAQHQRSGSEHSYPQVKLPTRQFMLGVGVRLSIEDLCLVA